MLLSCHALLFWLSLFVDISMSRLATVDELSLLE
jgi:hypothetical protein